MIFGRTVSYGVSDFINEIAPDLKENVNNSRKSYGGIAKIIPKAKPSVQVYDYLAETAVAKTTNKTLTLSDAVPGKKVRHTKFGVGTIVNVIKDGENTKLTIAFDNMGIKSLMLDVAPLEAI